MSRRCVECGEPGNRPHLVSCSYAPDAADREVFIREHAVQLVRGHEALERRLRNELGRMNRSVRYFKRENERLRKAAGNDWYKEQ